MTIASLFSAASVASAQVAAPAPQAAEPDALVRLRATYQQRARTSASTLNEYFARYLGSLELIAAASGDYEQAQAVRLRLEGLYPAMTAPTTASTSTEGIEIISSVDKLTGSVSVEEAKLTGWRTPSSVAEWTLRKTPPGKYSIEITYSMTDLSALAISRGVPVATADFIIREDSLLRADNKQTLAFATTPGTESTTFRSTGTLDLSHSPVTLKLAPTVSLPANRIIISSIKLIAATAPAVATPPTAGGTATAATPAWDGELAALQTAHEARLVSLRKPVVDTYTEQLHALAATTSVADEDSLDRIHEEQARAARLLSGKMPGGKGKKRPTVLDLEGYETLEDARFIADPANTGDRFKIEHNGVQSWLRLSWIAVGSDPALDPDKRHNRVVMDRFGVNAADAETLAKAGQEFTALYLEGRSLHIHTRGKKAKDGSLFGLVYIDEIGLYQNVLLDHGLAVVDAPPLNKDGKGLEYELLQTLREHEGIASNPATAVGGWLLRNPSAPAQPQP